MENFRQLMEIVGTAVDGVGVFIVAAGALVATARLLVRRAHNTGNYYSSFRQDIGRGDPIGPGVFDCRDPLSEPWSSHLRFKTCLSLD